MAIAFNEVPANIRLPFVYIEFDNSNAVQGTQLQSYKGLLVGQKTSAGSKLALLPVRLTSAAQAAEYFGPGSMLHGQAQAWFAQNVFTELWAVAFVDPDAAVAAAGSVAMTGTTTKPGTLVLYVAGRRVQVKVTAGDSLAALATSLTAAVNADTSLPVTAAVDGDDTAQVNLTAKNAGIVGNEIDIRLNYFGEETPEGLIPEITAMSGGTGAPDFATLWPKLGDEHYNIWSLPYTDAASLSEVGDELSRRSGPTRQVDAMAFMAKNGTVSQMGTYGNTLNEEFFCVVPHQNSPTPTYEKAAEVAAVVAQHGALDPARPFQTLELSWTKAPAQADRFTQQERNLLLFDGISTTRVTPGGKIALEALITTYQKNSFGADDPSYLYVNTILTMSYLRYDLRNYILRKYARHKLADDGTTFGSGQPIITPKLARAECATKLRQWEEMGLVENIDQAIQDMIVERNAGNRNRLDIMLPPDLVNQLMVIGVQLSPIV